MSHLTEWAEALLDKQVEDQPLEAVIDLHNYLAYLAQAILKDAEEAP